MFARSYGFCTGVKQTGEYRSASYTLQLRKPFDGTGALYPTALYIGAGDVLALPLHKSLFHSRPSRLGSKRPAPHSPSASPMYSTSDLSGADQYSTSPTPPVSSIFELINSSLLSESSRLSTTGHDFSRLRNRLPQARYRVL